MTMLVCLTPSDFVAFEFSRTEQIAARWSQAFGWSRFPASMPAAWLQVTVGGDDWCRWCVDGIKPDRSQPCPHCRGTRREARPDRARVDFGKTPMVGHVVKPSEAREFFAKWGHPFTSADVERLSKELEDAEIEANTRAHEERERLTDEHQKGEGDGYRKRE